MKCNTCGKINCYEHGGKVDSILRHEKGVNSPTHFGDKGVSVAGNAVRASNGTTAKDQHSAVLGELKAMPKPKLQGLAHGGEVGSQDEMDSDDMGDIDTELNDMLADELMQAIESKDKKQILESIRAIVLGELK